MKSRENSWRDLLENYQEKLQKKLRENMFKKTLSRTRKNPTKICGRNHVTNFERKSTMNSGNNLGENSIRNFRSFWEELLQKSSE